MIIFMVLLLIKVVLVLPLVIVKVLKVDGGDDGESDGTKTHHGDDTGGRDE